MQDGVRPVAREQASAGSASRGRAQKRGGSGLINDLLRTGVKRSRETLTGERISRMTARPWPTSSTEST